MRTQLNKIILAAGIMLAITFTLSCSKDDDDGGGASCGKLMSENLNVDGSVCYDNDPANCSKYGRLYDWATAMALPSKCNSILSTSDPECAIQSKHQGICPSGQHIPSKEEFNEYGSYSSTSEDFSGIAYAYYRDMYYDGAGAGYSYGNKYDLQSVRCVMN